MKRINLSIIFFVAMASILAGSNVFSQNHSQKNRQWTSTFQVAQSDFQSRGKNPYFILEPGYFLLLKGREGNTLVQLEITVLDQTMTIDGIPTRIVEEKETHNGQLVEVSRNYYALDKRTNSVWYFGEDVDIYRDGKIVSHEGSWHSGKKGAHFGLMMPGLPLVGAGYYQEIAEGVAMDRAEIVSVTEKIQVPAGEFANCLRTEETMPLEPGVKEYKIYAPNIGLVKDGKLTLVKYGYSNTR